MVSRYVQELPEDCADKQEREWYKHKVTAPGLWLGYGATTFPAITEGESPFLIQRILPELMYSAHYRQIDRVGSEGGR